ncbi:hypothetical protein Bbelb_005210 [Branchiostoma belcheri]|nr:hypothetical protein Bbelb_005210 [Branchiostoma belcheri]
MATMGGAAALQASWPGFQDVTAFPRTAQGSLRHGGRSLNDNDRQTFRQTALFWSARKDEHVVMSSVAWAVSGPGWQARTPAACAVFPTPPTLRAALSRLQGFLCCGSLSTAHRRAGNDTITPMGHGVPGRNLNNP